MYAKYEVDVTANPNKESYLLFMRDANTNSKLYNIVHVFLIFAGALFAILGLNELTGFCKTFPNGWLQNISQPVEPSFKSIVFLYLSIACFLIFSAMSLLDVLRDSILDRLKDLDDDECYRMSEFLKKAISQDVHNYVHSVRMLKRPFTVGEFRALVEHEEVSTRDLRLARAKEELYAIPPEKTL